MYIDFTRTLIFIILLFLATFVSAQRVSLSGKITAANDGQPLVGAMVTLADGEAVIRYGEATDENGRYVFDEIKPGRYALTINYVGYLTYVESGYLVGSGPATNRDFELQLNPDPTIEAVEVSSTRLGSVVVNPLKRQVKLEEVRRLPATFYDPARLLALSPGVAQTNDQANHLSVRGNSPNRNLWRLQGLAIVNPNHTANAGTINDQPTLSGGGVNALSAQLLDNSTFYAGGLPASYGNATAGTFDMRLRPGNMERRQHQVQAGFIGFDVATEGPFAKGKPNSGSYLVNYRYSFTGLLADFGVDFGGEEIRFQDFSAHLYQPVGKRGKLSLFGLYGASSNEFEGKDEDFEEDKELLNIDYKSDLFIGALTYEQWLGSGKLTFGAAYSSNDNRRKEEARDEALNYFRRNILDQNRTSARLDYAFNTSGSLRLLGGVEFLNEQVAILPQFFIDNDGDSYNQNIVSPYLEASHRFGDFSFSAGLRYSLYLDLEESGVLEPRLILNYHADRSLFSVTAERSSRVPTQGLISLFLFDDEPPRMVPATDQISLNWVHEFNKQNTLSISSYVQYTKDDYAVQFPFRFNNGFAIFANDQLGLSPELLFKQDTDTRSYGIEMSYKKPISSDTWYYTTNLALLRTESLRTNGQWSKGRFSRDFIFQGLVGKEWTSRNRKDKRRSYGTNLSLFVSGGQRFSPVAVNASQSLTSPIGTVYDYSNDHVDQLSTYVRPDLRLYRRKYHKKTTTTFSLDIQNLSGIENTAYRYFDQVTQQVEDRKQLGLIPVLSYRVEWR